MQKPIILSDHFPCQNKYLIVILLSFNYIRVKNIIHLEQSFLNIFGKHYFTQLWWWRKWKGEDVCMGLDLHPHMGHICQSKHKYTHAHTHTHAWQDYWTRVKKKEVCHVACETPTQRPKHRIPSSPYKQSI